MNSAADTICAKATAIGIGAIAVIRISGSNSIKIISKCFSKDLKNVPSHTVHFGVFSSTDEVSID